MHAGESERLKKKAKKRKLDRPKIVKLIEFNYQSSDGWSNEVEIWWAVGVWQGL